MKGWGKGESEGSKREKLMKRGKNRKVKWSKDNGFGMLCPESVETEVWSSPFSTQGPASLVPLADCLAASNGEDC